MSALDDLSPIQRHALWASCMDSNVPVQLADPATVERVTALLRSESPNSSEAGRSTRPAPLPFSINTNQPNGSSLRPNGSPPNGAPL